MRNLRLTLAGLAVTVCGLVAVVAGFTFYSLWQPSILACGGGIYCGGPYVPPNPYPVLGLFLVLIAAALVFGCWLLIEARRTRGLRILGEPQRGAPAVLLLVAGTWLLAFIISWRDYALEQLWSTSTRDAISGLFFASLVVAPGIVALAGIFLLRNLARSVSSASWQS